jgi:3-ketosteroid 9alpha-monooxygenase subunit A
VFASFGDDTSEADYYPPQRMLERGRELHPQYVLENGVDLEHVKYVHGTPIKPDLHPPRLRRPGLRCRLHHHFRRDDGQQIEDVNRGVEPINGGLGIAVTKSWGMIDNRTISAIAPVDDRTSDIRFMVYIGRPKREVRDPERARAKAEEFGTEFIRQFRQDVHIWAHQRYSDPPALASSELEGFTAIRKWALKFYPDGKGGSAAEFAARSTD